MYELVKIVLRLGCCLSISSFGFVLLIQDKYSVSEDKVLNIHCLISTWILTINVLVEVDSLSRILEFLDFALDLL